MRFTYSYPHLIDAYHRNEWVGQHVPAVILGLKNRQYNLWVRQNLHPNHYFFKQGGPIVYKPAILPHLILAQLRQGYSLRQIAELHRIENIEGLIRHVARRCIARMHKNT